MTKTTHERLKETMQEAWRECTLNPEDMKEVEIPKPDLTFLDQTDEKTADLEAEQEINLDFLPPGKKKRSFFVRFSTIAAVVCLVFITGSAMNLFWDSDRSYGVRSVIQNVKHFLSPREPEVNENGALSLKVHNWADIHDGEKVVGTLYLPEYVPEGYTFKMALFEHIDGMNILCYIYTKGGDELGIDISIATYDNDLYINGEPFREPVSGKKMYWAEEEDCDILSYVEEERCYSISASLPQKELLKVIEGIKSESED